MIQGLAHPIDRSSSLGTQLSIPVDVFSRRQPQQEQKCSRIRKEEVKSGPNSVATRSVVSTPMVGIAVKPTPKKILSQPCAPR